MAFEKINIGSAANDGTGDSVRASFAKANLLVDALNGAGITGPVTDPVTGAQGTVAELLGDKAQAAALQALTLDVATKASAGALADEISRAGLVEKALSDAVVIAKAAADAAAADAGGRLSKGANLADLADRDAALASLHGADSREIPYETLRSLFPALYPRHVGIPTAFSKHVSGILWLRPNGVISLIYRESDTHFIDAEPDRQECTIRMCDSRDEFHTIDNDRHVFSVPDTDIGALCGGVLSDGAFMIFTHEWRGGSYQQPRHIRIEADGVTVSSALTPLAANMSGKGPVIPYGPILPYPPGGPGAKQVLGYAGQFIKRLPLLDGKTPTAWEPVPITWPVADFNGSPTNQAGGEPVLGFGPNNTAFIIARNQIGLNGKALVAFSADGSATFGPARYLGFTLGSNPPLLRVAPNGRMFLFTRTARNTELKLGDSASVEYGNHQIWRELFPALFIQSQSELGSTSWRALCPMAGWNLGMGDLQFRSDSSPVAVFSSGEVADNNTFGGQGGPCGMVFYSTIPSTSTPPQAIPLLHGAGEVLSTNAEQSIWQLGTHMRDGGANWETMADGHGLSRDGFATGHYFVAGSDGAGPTCKYGRKLGDTNVQPFNRIIVLSGEELDGLRGQRLIFVWRARRGAGFLSNLGSGDLVRLSILAYNGPTEVVGSDAGIAGIITVRDRSDWRVPREFDTLYQPFRVPLVCTALLARIRYTPAPLTTERPSAPADDYLEDSRMFFASGTLVPPRRLPRRSDELARCQRLIEHTYGDGYPGLANQTADCMIARATGTETQHGVAIPWTFKAVKRRQTVDDGSAIKAPVGRVYSPSTGAKAMMQVGTGADIGAQHLALGRKSTLMVNNGTATVSRTVYRAHGEVRADHWVIP